MSIRPTDGSTGGGMTGKPVFFFSPHPGWAGAATPVPEPVRLVANKLNGRILTIQQGLDKLTNVMPAGFRLSVEPDCVLLWSLQIPHVARHCWRVLRYRPADGAVSSEEA